MMPHICLITQTAVILTKILKLKNIETLASRSLYSYIIRCLSKLFRNINMKFNIFIFSRTTRPLSTKLNWHQEGLKKSSTYFYPPPPGKARDPSFTRKQLKFSLPKDLDQVWLKQLALIWERSDNMNSKIYGPTERQLSDRRTSGDQNMFLVTWERKNRNTIPAGISTLTQRWTMSDLNVEMTLNFDWIWKLNGRRNPDVVSTLNFRRCFNIEILTLFQCWWSTLFQR